MTPRTRWAAGFGAAGLAAGLALGVTGLAGAANPSPSPGHLRQGPMHDERGPFGHHRGYGGLVSAVTGSALTLRAPDGTRTISLTSSTLYFRGPTKATSSAVKVGEVVRVRLVDPSAATPVAAVVTVVPAHLEGFVTAVGSDTITITDLSGFTRTIRTSGSTTYEKDGAASTRSDLAVGSLVRAEGTVDPDGTTLDATRVGTGRPAEHDGPGGAPMPMMDGPSA